MSEQREVRIRVIAGMAPGDTFPKRCYLCGRKGTVAFVPHMIDSGYDLVRVDRCSNTGACGMRRCKLRDGQLFGIGAEEILLARRRSSSVFPHPPEGET